MKNGLGEFDMAKVTGTFSHVFTARHALEVAIDCAETRVQKTA